VPFTAVLTNDDQQALGVAATLKASGIEGVSVQGFQALPQSAYADPPISTVDLNPRRLGSYASRLLIDQLEGQKLNVRHYIVRSTPVDRGSVFPPPREAVQPVVQAAPAFRTAGEVAV